MLWGSGRTGIRGTDDPLFAMRGGEAGEMARERNECDGSGFARRQLEMLGPESFLLNSRGGAVGWGFSAVGWYQVPAWWVWLRKDTSLLKDLGLKVCFSPNYC